MPIISPKIPQGLEELMKGLAKSVIKENPDNIYEFAAEYFENLLRERDDGTVDQSYKKFATYKVYKKSKMERRKREKECSTNIDERNLKLQQVSSFDGKISSVEEDNSIEKIILPDSEQPHLEVSQDIITSSESEIKTTVKQDSFVDDEGTPQQKSVNSEDEDNNKDIVLNDEETQAAVKIQSTFRGHRVRREMKGNDTSNEEKETCNLGNDNISASDDMQGSMEDKVESDNVGEEILLKEEDLNLNNDMNLETDDSNLDNVEKSGDANEGAEIQLPEIEINENTEQLQDENVISMGDMEGEINLENCSTEPNESELNDGKIAFDAKLSTDSTFKEVEDEAPQNSAENNIEENLQAENVLLMEGESNTEQIVINESLESNENIEINPNEEHEVENKSGDVLGVEQVDEIEIQNLDALNNLEKSESIKKEDDDISSMVLDEEMEEAALKIQSAFRGHQVRKDVKQQNGSVIDSSIDNTIACEQNGQEIIDELENVNEDPDVKFVSNDIETQDNIKIQSAEEIQNEFVEDGKMAENSDEVEKIIESVELIEENSIEKAPEVHSLDDKKEQEISAQSCEQAEKDENLEEEVIENSVKMEASQKESVDASRNNSTEILPNSNQGEKDVEDNLNESLIKSQEDVTQAILEDEPIEIEKCEEEMTIDTVQLSSENAEINQCQTSQDHSEIEITSDSIKNSIEKDEQNGKNEQQIVESDTEKPSPTNINYEQLRDSTDSHEKIESNATTTNENSIDADSKSIDSKNSLIIDDQESPADEVEIKLEKILDSEISPYEMFDEVVNQEAILMAKEITPQAEVENAPDVENEITLSSENDDVQNMVLDDEMEQAALKIQSSFRGHKVRKEKKNSLGQKENSDNMHTLKSIESSLDAINENGIEQITKPELLDLSVEDRSQNEGDQINDEILSPDKEESEIPEENNEPSNDILIPEQENYNDDKLPDLNPTDSLNEEKESDKGSETSAKDEENVEDNIFDMETEDSPFCDVQIQEDKSSTDENRQETTKQDSNETIIIEQCSEGNEEVQENDETEQQDTSADVDEIQESEAVEEQEENQTEEAEENNEAEQEEEEATETNEQGEGDPDEPEEAEGESSTQQENNDDDDVANMVLDEEMEQAALKIQSTFRGQKSRNATKSNAKQEEQKEVAKEDPVQEIDDEIANMVLDDEMEQAALKIQSAFRGNRGKKEESEAEKSEEKKSEEEEEEKKQESDEKKDEQPTTSEGSSEKTAKQLQDEEDIANLVMDDEMEKTALKIQSAFRGKIKKKSQKDDTEESYESEDYNADAEGSFQKSEENPSDMYEYFGISVECDEDCDGGYSAQRESYAEGGSYSIERDNAMSAYNDTIYPSENEADVDLMHGGGIFPETSGESSGTLESSADYMSEDNNRNDPPEDKKDIYKRLSESPVNDEEQLVENESEKKAIESFDFDTNKDTAEALYYSLKKNEIEAQKRFESCDKEASQEQDDFSNNEMNEPEKGHDLDIENSDNESDDNDDVVVSPSSNDVQKLKYGMSMDERLLGSILSQDYSKGRKIYPDEMFDPLLEEAMSSNYNVLDKLRELSKSEEEKNIDDNNVGEEDQFDDFYPGNIRSKIMASSISIADSDYFDPTNNKSIIDDDRIRTALETIHSTDSESTIGSAATKIQASDKNLAAHRNKTFQYSSIGNAAIDRSLDEFIQSQELKIDRFEEEPEGYNSPPPKKQESADDFTDDTCTESEKRPTMAGIIEIKLEQKNFLTIDERRRTLHREDAIQRNSTRSVDEDNSKSSPEKNLEKSNSQPEITTSPQTVQEQNSVLDTEISVPVLEKPKSISKAVKVPIRRQKTMPVQIESNVIRVLPKHLRKRIRSADSDKKKRTPKQ